MTGKGFVSYDKLIDAALRGVVREVLRHVAEHGLSGPHHIYLTFRTGFPGVEMPEFLRSQYPDEMTIVLQHQFWGLEVAEESFAVSLSFNKAPQRLAMPFAALTRFADPGVNFGLQFQGAAPVQPGAKAEAREPSEGAQAQATPAEAAQAAPAGEAKVITLDSFRKK